MLFVRCYLTSSFLQARHRLTNRECGILMPLGQRKEELNKDTKFSSQFWRPSFSEPTVRQGKIRALSRLSHCLWDARSWPGRRRRPPPPGQPKAPAASSSAAPARDRIKTQNAPKTPCRFPQSTRSSGLESSDTVTFAPPNLITARRRARI